VHRRSSRLMLAPSPVVPVAATTSPAGRGRRRDSSLRSRITRMVVRGLMRLPADRGEAGTAARPTEPFLRARAS
jgi:hypothetical protein